MVAATTHGEGATTTSAILASTLARSGHSRILLIDANLRTPALGGVFDDADHPEGLSDVVAADVPVESVIYQTNFPNLFLLPVGKSHPAPSYLFDGDPIASLAQPATGQIRLHNSRRRAAGRVLGIVLSRFQSRWCCLGCGIRAHAKADDPKNQERARMGTD